MMKRFSTRADKWFYVFALISHIFNFFAESQILFFYHIVDHQENHFFCWFYRLNQSSNNFVFLFVHFYHLSCLLFFQFTFIIFFFLFFLFCFSFLFSFSFSLFFFSFFNLVDRLNLVFRCLSWSVRSSENQKNSFLFFFLILFLFLLLLLQNVSRH